MSLYILYLLIFIVYCITANRNVHCSKINNQLVFCFYFEDAADLIPVFLSDLPLT